MTLAFLPGRAFGSRDDAFGDRGTGGRSPDVPSCG